MDFLFIILGVIGIIVRSMGRKGKSKNMEWIGSILAIASFTVLTVMYIKDCGSAIPK